MSCEKWLFQVDNPHPGSESYIRWHDDFWHWTCADFSKFNTPWVCSSEIRTGSMESLSRNSSSTLDACLLRPSLLNNILKVSTCEDLRAGSVSHRSRLLADPLPETGGACLPPLERCGGGATHDRCRSSGIHDVVIWCRAIQIISTSTECLNLIMPEWIIWSRGNTCTSPRPVHGIDMAPTALSFGQIVQEWRNKIWQLLVEESCE